MAGCGLYLSRSLRALRALRGGGAPLAPRMCPFLSPFSSVSDSAGVRGVRDDTIRDLFFSFAHPGDGDEQEPYLDASDLGHLLGALGERVTPQRVDRLLRQVDEDDSGTISLGEFLAGHEHLLQHTGDEDDLRGAEGEPTDLEHLIETFGTLDITGSGDLRVEDLEGLLSTTGGHLSREDAEEIIGVGGSNGKIDIHEFISLCSDPEMAGLSWRLRSGFRAVLVIGGPGSGKGILSERLIRCAGIDHVSSGDLLRVEVESGSALGKSCAETMKQGKLLPSSTIMALMKKSMSRSSGHWVALDGFLGVQPTAKTLRTCAGSRTVHFILTSLMM